MPKRDAAVNALRSQMTVNVTGRLPKQYEPWPANSDEILLGTATAPPTGFHTPKDAAPGSMSRSLAGPYADLAGAAPFVAQRTPSMYDLDTPIAALKSLLGLGSYNPKLDVALFTEKPPASRMGHETIHRMQTGNFLDSDSAARAWNPQGGGELAYLDRAGEQQAFKAEELLNQRLSRRRAAAHD